jgi:ribose-phosphate pyrophosphokinase
MRNLTIVGSVSDDAQAQEIADRCGQKLDVSDIISLKEFTNTEFCPRFISDEKDPGEVGYRLAGRTVVIVSTAHIGISRNELAMRNFLIARAAKDNGAERVILLEPDLFYSAQDRGPRRELGHPEIERSEADLKKFDGQPCSAKLYAELLRMAGVDEVITVHNHSIATKRWFNMAFDNRFTDLIPTKVYGHYFTNSDVICRDSDGSQLVIAAPDRGARAFAGLVREAIGLPNIRLAFFEKLRADEDKVKIELATDSPVSFEQMRGKDIVIVDDMVRTGSTIVACAELIKTHGTPRRIVFLVTHFYASHQGRVKMFSSPIDEIVTTDTIPPILSRDVQGRLRRKLVVLRLPKWIAWLLLSRMQLDPSRYEQDFYDVDMSSRNPRYKRPNPVL